MAGDLAQLGIQVDSSQAKAASGDLDRLASSAAGAQKATDGLRDANTSATGATAQSAAATKALRDAIASNATVTSEMIQAAGGWSAAQKVMADASRATASTIAKSAETQIAANDAVALSATESAAVQVAAHGAVAGSSVKIRESLVLLREASVGNYTRMAGSASILIQAFGLMETVLLPLVAVGAALGSAFLLGSRQINQASGDLTKGLGLTADQLKKVTDRTVTLKDTALATFQVLGKDISSEFSGAISDIGKVLDAITDYAGRSLAAIAGGFDGTFQGIKATWKMLPSVLGDFFVTAANDALSVLQTLINGSVTGINAVIEASNKMNAIFGNGTQLGLIQAPDLGQIKNDYAGAGTTAADAFSGAFKKGYAEASAATNQFFTDVANQARKNRIADIVTEAGKAAVKNLKDLSTQADDIINRLAAQYERQQKTYDDFHAKLAEEVVLAGQSADERERSVAEQKEIKLATEMGIAPQLQMVDALVQQRQEAERLQKVSQGVTTSFQDFFTTVFSGGKDAFHNLVDSIKNQFAQLLAWMVTQAIAQPIIVPVIGAITGAATGAAGLLGAGGLGGASGIGNIFGSLGTVSSAGSLAGAGGFLGGIGSQISSAANWLTSGINNIGASLGFSAGTSFGGISTVGVTPSVLGTGGFAAPNIAGSSSLLGGTTLTGLLGGAGLGLGVGSMLSSLTGGNSTGGSIGGALGGAIGSVVPVIGTLVGSIAGGLIGGLFGPGKSAGKASATFDANGVITGYGGDKATDKSTQAVQTAAQTISSVVQTLSSAGVDISNSISKLVIADNRDKSFIVTSDGKQQTVGAVGDPNSAIQGTLDYLLKGASSSDANISQVLKHYQATDGITSSNASQVASDIAFAKSLENISFDTTKQLSQAATALKTLNDNYQTAIDRAKSLGLSTYSLAQAQAHDVALLQKSTSDAYVSQFQSVTDGLKPLSNYQSAIKSINDALTQATSDMTDLGGSLADVTNAANQAKTALAGAFNKDISTQLLTLTDPIKASMDALIATQNQRLLDAQAIGGDIAQVTALNRAEIANAMKQYSDAVVSAQEDLASKQADLANVQASFVQSTAQTVQDAQSELQNAYQQASSGFQSTISQFTGIAQSLRQAISQIAVSFAGNAPNTTGVTHQQFLDAVTGAKSGNADAYSALPGTAQGYLQALQQTATTPQELALAQAQVRSALSDAAKSADQQVSVAQQQLAALNASVTGLIAINANVVSVAQAISDLANAQVAQDNATAASQAAQLATAQAAVLTAQAALATAQNNQVQAQALATAAAASQAASITAQQSAVVVAASAAMQATAAAQVTAAAAAATAPATAAPHTTIDNTNTANAIRTGTGVSGRIGRYATGGAFGEGWAQVGEMGPELVRFGAPGQVYSNSNSKSLLDTSALEAEVASLRAQNEEMLREMKASRANQQQMINMWKRFSRGGDALVVTDGGTPIQTEAA